MVSLCIFCNSNYTWRSVREFQTYQEYNKIFLQILFLSHRCRCPRGWSGVDCGEDIKECASSPCLNGAHCLESDIPGEFSCTCPPFFTGSLCEHRYDPCDPHRNPCQHDSACRGRSDGTVLCVCPPGEIYQPNCILPVDPPTLNDISVSKAFSALWSCICNNFIQSSPYHAVLFCLMVVLKVR